MLNIILLHNQSTQKQKPSTDTKRLIKRLKDISKLHIYKFKLNTKQSKYEDMFFETVAKDINDTYKELKSYFVIALDHACPYGLYFVNKYPKKCLGIVCYPYRYYCEESLKRRVWKYKKNKGYEKIVSSYDVDKYMININEERFNELKTDKSDDGVSALYLAFDYNLQKQHTELPTKFKVSTTLYTRLDLDTESIVKLNYNRKNIAKMKNKCATNKKSQ